MAKPSRPRIKMEFEIAKDKAADIPTKDTAKRLGLVEGTVRNARTRPSVKALVERMKQELIDTTLPKAVANIRQAIENYDKPLERDHMGKPMADGLQARDHGMMASIRLMEGAGLVPSKSQAIYIQNIDNSVTIMPLVRQLIASKLEEVDEDEIVDI